MTKIMQKPLQICQEYKRVCQWNKAFYDIKSLFFTSNHGAKFLFKFIWPCRSLQLPIIFLIQNEEWKVPPMSVECPTVICKIFLRGWYSCHVIDSHKWRWWWNDDGPDICFVSDKKSSSEAETSPPLSPASPFIRWEITGSVHLYCNCTVQVYKIVLHCTDKT